MVVLLDVGISEYLSFCEAVIVNTAIFITAND